jgi:hypothetical protein
VLYAYDRFVMPIVFLLAPFAGLALDRVVFGPTETGRHDQSDRRTSNGGSLTGVASGFSRIRSAGMLFGTVAFAYTALYAATVNLLMIHDSRYAVEDWLRAHVGTEDVVAYTFPLDYLPGVDAFRHEEVRSIEALAELRPAFYVLNEDYARAVPPESPTGQLIAGLQADALGYRRAVGFRTASPWPWLPAAHHDLTGPRLEKRVSTILRNVNPTTAVFVRER